MAVIELLGMEFRARHGCLDWEKTTDQSFVVDFCARYDTRAAERSDALEDTLDYSAVYAVIAAQMAVPSNLLEHLCGRIERAIATRFPFLEEFSISVSKLSPAVGGPAKCARVSVEHKAGK